LKGFQIITKEGEAIRFSYLADAPLTAAAFHNLLPFTRTFYHARVSGHEIWIDDLPSLNVTQENASVFTLPGEVVAGPAHPARNKTANCFGIYYGEGKGLDAANIFAKVLDEDFEKLRQLGQTIWQQGAQELDLHALI
jgi:hypothetical protein